MAVTGVVLLQIFKILVVSLRVHHSQIIQLVIHLLKSLGWVEFHRIDHLQDQAKVNSTPKYSVKCWICGSASHMRSACPKGNRTNSANGLGRPPVQSACTTVGHTNENSPLLNTDHENSVSNGQVNRCVVESCDDRVTDDCDDCSPVMLCLDKTNQPLTVNNISKSEYEVNHICNTEP